MPRNLLIALPLCSFLVCAPTIGVLRPESKRQTAAQVIARMLAKYDNAASYRGTISSVIIDRRGTIERLIRAKATGNGHGSVTRSRAELISSSGAAGGRRQTSQMTRVDDGRDVWTYFPGSREYTKADRKPERLSSLFQQLLKGARKFGPEFKVRLAVNSQMESRRRYIISGVDRKRGRVEIHIDADTYALLGAHAVAANGNELRIETIDQQWGGKFPDSDFRFEPPPGSRLLPHPRPGGIFGAQ